MTIVESIAEWGAGLSYGDVPVPVLDLCRVQRRSVLAGVAASADDAAAGRVLAAVGSWAGDGPAPLVTTERRVTVEDAVYAATALSVALDFDDYVCFGHTGHSAVLVPILMAAETGADGAEQLVAQVIANEVEARLGGAALLGPMNGQLWAHIHAAGAALAAGRLLGLGGSGLAHALAIALAHPLRGTVPGFMAPDSKLLVAAEPSAAGIRAARLAAAGMTGPLDAIEHPRGALEALTFAPIRGMLTGLGHGWATATLSVKPYPGCAYVDTTVDAVLSLGLGALEPEEVASVTVEAGVLTCGMDALSAPYAAVDPPTPVTVTFSVRWNVAIALCAGRLTERETSQRWLRANRDHLATVGGRVRVQHAPELTARSVTAFADVLPPGLLRRELGTTRLLRAAARLHHEHPSIGLGAADVTALARAIARGRPGSGGPTSPRWWDPGALERFRATFPARVSVRLRGGAERVAEVVVPRGGAGNDVVTPDHVGREKLSRCGPPLWGGRRTVELDAATDVDAAGLHELLGGRPAFRTPAR